MLIWLLATQAGRIASRTTRRGSPRASERPRLRVDVDALIQAGFLAVRSNLLANSVQNAPGEHSADTARAQRESQSGLQRVERSGRDRRRARARKAGTASPPPDSPRTHGAPDGRNDTRTTSSAHRRWTGRPSQPTRTSSAWHELEARIDRYLAADREWLLEHRHPLRSFLKDIAEYGEKPERKTSQCQRCGMHGAVNVGRGGCDNCRRASDEIARNARQAQELDYSRARGH